MTKHSVCVAGKTLKQPSHRSVQLHRGFDSYHESDFSNWNSFSYDEPEFYASGREHDLYVPSEEFKITQAEILNLFDLLVKVVVGFVLAFPVVLGLAFIIVAMMIYGLQVFGIGFLPFGILGVLAGAIFVLRMVLVAFMKWIKIPK